MLKLYQLYHEKIRQIKKGEIFMYLGSTKVKDAYLLDILVRKQNGGDITDLEEIIAEFAIKLISAKS